MKKDLKYYMGLPYEISIKQVSEELGGGYTASIPLIGEYTFEGHGETIEEALRSLEEIKEDLFEDYLNNGHEIPEPIKEEEEYSGKLLLRIPKILHRIMAQAAKENDVSLNQYLVHLLSFNMSLDKSSARREKRKQKKVASAGSRR